MADNKDKGARIVRPRERTTVYGTKEGKYIKEGEAKNVSTLLVDKLIATGQVTLEKPKPITPPIVPPTVE